MRPTCRAISTSPCPRAAKSCSRRSTPRSTPPVIDNWNQLTDIVGKELEAAKLGQKTPQQALTDAAAAVKSIL